MDPRADGAMELLTALHDARKMFGKFGEEQSLTHPTVDWNWSRVCGRIGHGVDPLAMVGTSIGLKDDEDREVFLGIDVWVCDEGFKIDGDATVDDPLPQSWGAGNQRFLIDLPDVRTSQMAECIATIRKYTAHLCGATSILDDLGVPRTKS